MKLGFYLFISIILGVGCIDAIAQCTPVTKNVSGGGTLPCSGGSSVNVVLEQAEFEAYYILYKDGTEVTGSSKYNNSQALPDLTWPVSAAGTYTVKAYLDGCSSTTRYSMVGSATVTTTTPTNITISSSDPSNNVCENTGYALTATGGSGYTWYANVTLDYPINSATIHPDLSGTYYVTGYNNCGTLQTSNNITVTIRNNVLPPSVPAVSSGSQMTCKGSHANTTYTSSATNATSYSWTIDGGHSVSSSGVVTWNPNFSGTATLTVYASGCGTTQSTPLSINVSTLPAATLSASTATNLCVNETASITLTGNPTLDPDATYTFLRDGTTNAGQFFGHDANDQPIASNSLSESVPGTYTAVGSNAGCSNVPMSGSVTITRKDPTNIAISSSDPSNNVCENTGYALTATGGSGFTWHADVTMDYPINSPSINPELSGTYYVTGSNNCGTSQTSNNITVTIRNNVMVPSIPTVVPGYSQMSCKGAHADTPYTSSATNANSYTWSIDGGHSVSSSGVVTWNPNFSGTATLTVYASGCGPTQSNHQTIVVNTIATATISAGGNTNLCVGESSTITLTGNPMLDPDASYKFLLDGATNAGQFFGHDNNDQPIASQSLSESTPGTYTAVASNGGCVNVPMSGSVVITRKDPTTLSITPSRDLNTLCDGDAVTLTATGCTSTVWIMRPSAGSNEGETQVHPTGGQDNIYSPVEGGIYYARGTDTNCNTIIQSADTAVIFWSYPVVYLNPADSTTICTTCNVEIDAPQDAAFTYAWKKNGVAISGATSRSYTANQAGVYSVDVARHGCMTTASTKVKMNQLPIANAGADASTFLIPNKVFRRAAAYSDPDGTVTSFQWSKISGPSVTILDGQTSVASFTDLVAGTYSFRVAITDNFGDVGSDDFLLLVLNVTNNRNYVKEAVVTVPGKMNSSDVEIATVDETIVKTSYIDGLGRGWQTVQWNGSPQRLDIVQPMAYDQFGREKTKYLPYVGGTNGQFKTDFVRKEDPSYATSSNPQYQFYQAGGGIAQDTAPYAETEFESSPLNRVLRQGSAGGDWQLTTNHVVTKNYLTNSDTTVFLFNYDPATGDVSFSPGVPKYYPLNTLVCNKTIDEQGNDVLEYIDKQGRTICKKVKAPGNTYACTYYIYDDLGNLVVVLPPEGVQRILQTN